jgi:hypothetical protein
MIEWLKKTGLAEITAVVLEAAGALTILGAQAVLMLEPLVSKPGGAVRDLARTLEDPVRVGDLVQRLRDQGGSK